MFVANCLLLVLLAWPTLALSESSSACIFKDCKCNPSGPSSIDVYCIYDEETMNVDPTLFPARLLAADDDAVDANSILASTNESTVAAKSTSVTTPNINTMLIKKYKFTTIPADAFAGLAIRNLIIGENELTELGTASFRGIRSLDLLRIIERRFERIEPDALAPLGDKLRELGIWQLNFRSEHIDSLLAELRAHSAKLRTLKLMGYGLKKFRTEWLELFRNVTSLSLASNDLSALQVDLLETSRQLVSLDLSNNMLDDMLDTYATLAPVQRTLKDLKLSGNGIQTLADFPAFNALEILDLSNNKLTELSATVFAKLPRLNHLYLSDNRLARIDPATFATNPYLLVLLINNNRLATLPSIGEQTRLQILDVSNQNGELHELTDYSLERKRTPINSLNLNIDGNDVLLFANRTFCSRNYNATDLSQLGITAASVARMSICTLKQIGSRSASSSSGSISMTGATHAAVKTIVRITRFDQATPTASSASAIIDANTSSAAVAAASVEQKDVCSCGTKAFLANYNIQLAGVCESNTGDMCADEAGSLMADDVACLTDEIFNCNIRSD